MSYSKRRSHHEAHHFHYSCCRDCYVPGAGNRLLPTLAVGMTSADENYMRRFANVHNYPADFCFSALQQGA
jgi:hypothetical protein